MNMTEQKIRKIINELYNQLSFGWRDFLIAKNIRRLGNAQEIKSAFGFFQGVYEACLYNSCLSIAKVVLKDERGKPVNIWYLLNCLEDGAEELPEIGKQLILDSINLNRKQLEEFASTINKIGELRHNIAHIDKKRVTNPDKLYIYALLSEVDMEDAYKLAVNIINTYLGYIKPSEDISYLFDYWDEMIKDDVEFIVRATGDKQVKN